MRDLKLLQRLRMIVRLQRWLLVRSLIDRIPSILAKFAWEVEVLGCMIRGNPEVYICLKAVFQMAPPVEKPRTDCVDLCNEPCMQCERATGNLVRHSNA